jgi:hypothetical protein
MRLCSQTFARLANRRLSFLGKERQQKFVRTHLNENGLTHVYPFARASCSTPTVASVRGNGTATADGTYVDCDYRLTRGPSLRTVVRQESVLPGAGAGFDLCAVDAPMGAAGRAGRVTGARLLAHDTEVGCGGRLARAHRKTGGLLEDALVESRAAIVGHGQAEIFAGANRG